MGISEESLHQVADLEARSIAAIHRRNVHVSPPVFGMLDVAFLLENANRGQNGVVGQRRVFGQGVAVLDGDRVPCL